MRKLSMLAVPLAALWLVGCNESPEGGTTGTDSTFTLKAPMTSTNIKQGDTETVTVDVDRDDAFKQSVKLSVTEPKGIRAELNKTTLAAGDPDEVALTIKVDKEAALGDHVIKVTGTPDSGKATTVDVKVTVEAGPK